MTRVTVVSLSGDPMLYRTFRRMSDARAWAKWARETMPCTVRITRDGNDAANDNGCAVYRDDTLAVI